MQTEIDQIISDYMRGFIARDPGCLAQIYSYPNWRSMAIAALDQRAKGFLDLLPGDALCAIADGNASLPDIARRLMRQ